MAAETITRTCSYLLTAEGALGDPCDGTAEHPVHAVCSTCGIPSDDIICADHRDALADGLIRCSYCLGLMISVVTASPN